MHERDGGEAVLVMSEEEYEEFIQRVEYQRTLARTEWGVWDWTDQEG